MKVRDFLRGIIDPLKLKDQEIETALTASALGEIELPDSLTAKFNDNYLTIDRAVADERVHRQARGMAYTMVEQRFSKKILPKLKEEDRKNISEAKELFDKIDLMESALDHLAASPDDVKKVQEAWRKTEGELRNQIKTFEETAKKSEESKKAELEGLKMDYALRAKLAGQKLAPEYDDEDQKEFLASSTIDFLKKNYIPQFDEKNPSIIHLRKNVDGAIVDVYEGDNKKLTLDDVVKKRYEKFTPKNNADGKDKDKPRQEALKIPSDKPLTLQDMHKLAAGATA